MNTTTRHGNLLFDFFKNAKSSWLSDSPCPVCKNGIALCNFCSFNPSEFVSDVRQKCNLSNKKRKLEEEKEGEDTDCSLENYLEKHKIALETKYCCVRHYSKKKLEECEKLGYVHSMDKLRENYNHPLIKKYFMNNLIKQKQPNDRLPSLPLNPSNLFTNHFYCLNSKQDDRNHYVSVTIYTHDKNGRLRPPMCNLRCRVCGQTTSICVYESCVNKLT